MSTIFKKPTILTEIVGFLKIVGEIQQLLWKRSQKIYYDVILHYISIIRVGCCMFFPSRVLNFGYRLLKQTPLETLEILNEEFAVASLQTKQLDIVMKVVRNYDKLEDVLQFCENYNLEHSVLKKE